ncbi:hypothetical protein E6H19_01700 [Candidatus Bathyarchaeota archaeon]|nr:MAG: hypothetical protein E6H19_01700 [Candidatus Bathyarchaeota archaeon]
MLEAPYLLRPFHPDDLSSVIEINRVCLPENYSPYFFLEVYKSCPEAFIIAEKERKVAGYIMCRLEFGFSKTWVLTRPGLRHTTIMMALMLTL